MDGQTVGLLSTITWPGALLAIVVVIVVGVVAWKAIDAIFD